MTRSIPELNFNRGIKLSMFGTVFHWKTIDRAKADRAWRNLADERGSEIEFSSSIAKAMGFKTYTDKYGKKRYSPTVAKYRRVFNNLKLIRDIPGEFIKDNPKASTPARILIDTHEPDAFVNRIGQMEAFVLNQTNPTWRESMTGMSQPLQQSPVPVFVYKPHLRLSGLSHSTLLSSNPSINSLEHHASETNFAPFNILDLPEVWYTPISLRERNHQRLMDSFAVGETFKVADIEEKFNLSRAQAYRRIKEWMEREEAEQVSRGTYRVVDTKARDVAKLEALKARVHKKM